MIVNALTVPERLGKNRYVLDEGASHIRVNQEVARRTGVARILVNVCPARVYRAQSDGTIGVEYAGCLECGACLAVAPPGSLEWHYPKGGRGVQFREG